MSALTTQMVQFWLQSDFNPNLSIRYVCLPVFDDIMVNMYIRQTVRHNIMGRFYLKILKLFGHKVNVGPETPVIPPTPYN